MALVSVDELCTLRNNYFNYQTLLGQLDGCCEISRIKLVATSEYPENCDRAQHIICAISMLFRGRAVFAVERNFQTSWVTFISF